MQEKFHLSTDLNRFPEKTLLLAIRIIEIGNVYLDHRFSSGWKVEGLSAAAPIPPPSS